MSSVLDLPSAGSQVSQLPKRTRKKEKTYGETLDYQLEYTYFIYEPCRPHNFMIGEKNSASNWFCWQKPEVSSDITQSSIISIREFL